MQIVELLVSLDIAAGGGILTKIGYLWGDAAAHLLREPELFCCPDLDVHRNMNGTRCGKKRVAGLMLFNLRWSRLHCDIVNP